MPDDRGAWKERLTTFPLDGKIPLIPWKDLPAGARVTGPPGCNYGIATGTRSGIIVVDCDTAEAAVQFCQTYLPVGTTHTVKTRRGYHFYFQQPDFPVRNSASKLLPHVDVRGEGGMVVMEGSTHRDGHYEVFDSTPPMVLPKELYDALAMLGATVAKQPPEVLVSLNSIDPQSDEGQRRIEMAIEFLKTKEETYGSKAMLDVCVRLVRKLELPVDVALGLIEEHYNPRCTDADGQPWPWTRAELVHKLEDVRDNSPVLPGLPPDGFLDRVASERPQQEGASTSDGIPAAAGGKASGISFPDLCQTLYNSPEWDGVLRFDVMRRQPTAVNPPIPLRMQHGAFSDGDVGRIRLWLAEKGVIAKPDDIRTAVPTVYEMPDRQFNPIVEWLDSLPAVDLSQPLMLDRVHETVLNSPDGPIASQIFKKQLVAAVRRARAMPGLHQPVVGVDHRVVVVMDGPQECGKSSLLRQLGGKWYASLGGDVREDDVLLALQGKLIVEMEEMISAKKSDREALKRFISAPFDEIRAKYARSAERVQRSYVLFGTSNELRFDDPTGNARFAVIKVGKLCGETAFMAIRDQLWAEANALALSGYSHYLDVEEKSFAAERVKDYELTDTLADQLRENLAGIPFITTLEAYRIVWQSKAEPTCPKAEEQRISDSLRRIGCLPDRVMHKRGWRVPDEIATKAKVASITAWLRGDEVATRVRDRMNAKAN